MEGHMDIPLNAAVRCADGEAGRTTFVILNPLNRQVTHLVVKSGGIFAGEDRLVPVDYIVEATPEAVLLRCTLAELEQMKPFTEFQFLPAYEGRSGLLMLPYAEPLEPLPVAYERVPAGELAVRRGDHVQATDGKVGKVDEFLVDPISGQITHLIMREGHLWGQKAVTIPVAQIDRIESGTVYLNTDRHTIEQLPAIPLSERRGNPQEV
jgi:hypothetical protein